jgi:hypothetical protein
LARIRRGRSFGRLHCVRLSPRHEGEASRSRRTTASKPVYYSGMAACRKSTSHPVASLASKSEASASRRVLRCVKPERPLGVATVPVLPLHGGRNEPVKALLWRPLVVLHPYGGRPPDADQATSWTTGTPEDWAWEAFAMAQEDAYGDPPLSTGGVQTC